VLKKTLFVAAVLAATSPLVKGAAFAQQVQAQAVTPTATEQDIQMLRQDIRSQKKQLVAANMPLTDAEAEKFWPVYDQYTAETIPIGDTKWGVIKEYAQRYDSLTDAEALSLINRWLGTDVALSQLRVKYVPIFNKVLPGKKTAIFMQIDRRIGLLLDVQLAAGIPLAQP